METRKLGNSNIAWALLNPAVTGAIVGLRKLVQTAGVIGATDFTLSKSEQADIELFFAEHPVQVE